VLTVCVPTAFTNFVTPKFYNIPGETAKALQQEALTEAAQRSTKQMYTTALEISSL